MRFFIHVDNGIGPQRDEAGSEFADSRLAVGEAAKMAGEILRDETRDQVGDRALRLVVEAEDRGAIAEINVTLSVEKTNIC